jgi:hypothetical protein
LLGLGAGENQRQRRLVAFIQQPVFVAVLGRQRQADPCQAVGQLLELPINLCGFSRRGQPETLPAVLGNGADDVIAVA